MTKEIHSSAAFLMHSIQTAEPKLSTGAPC